MQAFSHGHILAAFFSANSTELADGAGWYQRAIVAADNIAAQYSLTTDMVAGVIAALSPNNKWQRNVSDTDRLCRAYALGGHAAAEAIKCSTYSLNKIKALRILSGEACLDVLGGMKVRSFYQCIIGDFQSICVDGHAYAIWAGDRIPTTKTPKISAKLYSAIAADYLRAADTINSILGAQYSGAQIQAITWLAYRRLVSELGIYRSAES